MKKILENIEVFSVEFLKNKVTQKEKCYKLRILDDDEVMSLVYFNLDTEAVYFDRVSKKSKRTKRLNSLQLVQVLAQMILSNDFHDCAIMLFDDEKEIETLHFHNDDFETLSNLIEIS